jgi:hypothetical protein
MTKKLIEYTAHREQSLPMRIFKSDKPRFEELQKRLTMANGGIPFSQAQVMQYLLDMANAIEKFVNQEPPES